MRNQDVMNVEIQNSAVITPKINRTPNKVVIKISLKIPKATRMNELKILN